MEDTGKLGWNVGLFQVTVQHTYRFPGPPQDSLLFIKKSLQFSKALERLVGTINKGHIVSFAEAC